MKNQPFILPETYVNQNGVTRHKAEPLVVMKVTAAAAGDAGVTGAGDDSTVADS